MVYIPITEEEYNKAINSGFKQEDILKYEKQRMVEEDNNKSPLNQRKDRFSLKSDTSNENYNYGDAALDTGKTILNTLANLGESVTQPIMHPIQTLKGLMQGAGQALSNPIGTVQAIGQDLTSTDNPDNVPNWARSIHTDPLAFASAVVSTGALGEMSANTALPFIKKIAKFDTASVQAKKAKTALDTVRTNLGKAKEIALMNTKDIPAEIDFSGNLSQKVINAIKNPIYKVDFTDEGGVVNNIGNLDKIKTALNDLVTTKDFVEAGNMEKRQIMQFAGKIRNSMVKVADDAGKPELGNSLKDYHEFMDNYNKINDHLVDKYGDAVADKLKSTFTLFKNAETKQAWKDVGVNSPELKSIMSSMQKRELLKRLLQTGATAEGVRAASTGHL